MKKFLRHVLLFSVPIFAFLIAVIWFYFQVRESGELNNIDDNIIYQRENELALLGLGYYESTPYYKLTNVNYYHPPIVALGTSRVMQYQKGFFHSAFYNCGGAVTGNYNEYLNFIKNMEYKPECIILGLDAWVFNLTWNEGLSHYDDFEKIQARNLNKKDIIKTMFEDYKSGKWKPRDLTNYQLNIGFNGKIKDAGFMSDGSYYYGDVYRNPEIQVDYKFVNTLERIKTGTKRFEWGEEIDQDTILQLENLLKYCKDNNIYVIGFSAPFAPTIYDTMINSGNYGYLSKISPACNMIFDDYGFEYYDFLDVRGLGMTDDYFVDGFHGSEVVYGNLLMQMVSLNSKVSEYVDVNRTKMLLEAPYNNLVFDNPDY